MHKDTNGDIQAGERQVTYEYIEATYDGRGVINTTSTISFYISF